MRIGTAFPSNYLKAADLDGRTVKVIMAKVQVEDIGTGDRKPVLYFEGKQKGLVLNKTNSNTISHAYGDETDDWQGQAIELFEAMVDFKGDTVAAIRVRVPRQPRQPANGAAAQHSERNPPPVDDLDSDIPF